MSDSSGDPSGDANAFPHSGPAVSRARGGEIAPGSAFLPPFVSGPPPPAAIPEAPEDDLAWLDDILGSSIPLPGGIEAGDFTSARLEVEEPISLARVAARLEQVAASLRHRSAEELIADWRSSSVADPLEALLTGFVLGYEQGRDRRE